MNCTAAPAVGRLPPPAARRADVERLRVPARARHGERRHAPAVRRWPEVAEREALEEPRAGVLGSGGVIAAAGGGVGGPPRRGGGGGGVALPRRGDARRERR